MLEYRAREQCAPLRMLFRHGLRMRGHPAFIHFFNSAHGVGTGACGLCAISLRGMLSTTVTTARVDNDLLMHT